MARFYAVVVQVLCFAVVANGQGFSGCGSELFRVTNFRDSNIQEPRVYVNESTVTICIAEHHRFCRTAR